ncbi:Uncharacterised protein [Chryseobacterium gleum]|uniref:Uncharacterized protein n=2 Tax=Chryseobacterium gleum TaxID=250 RepID=A0A448B7Z9_CHRGE|nr:hypothetical protein [Chryseobacterium gleum]EFK36820.1 hypothetical protein HMPREF0204_11377 [Chryseobacterium gleum ATCC 35910]QQY32074.1 hypothetical protein I6I60_25135 [Chryseobacterium gleum]VEE10705.1 Uncharacterised protein [Chryseobacterium gleum]
MAKKKSEENEGRKPEYVKFHEMPFEGKTKRFMVESLNGGFNLGNIIFYPQWRTYTFQPNPNTIFDSKCLNEIINFLKSLNEDRKQNLKMK